MKLDDNDLLLPASSTYQSNQFVVFLFNDPPFWYSQRLAQCPRCCFLFPVLILIICAYVYTFGFTCLCILDFWLSLWLRHSSKTGNQGVMIDRDIGKFGFLFLIFLAHKK